MELVFDRRGSGEPLVLLHGLGGHRGVFSPVIDLLAGDFDVWSVDMPGFGRSPSLPGGVPAISALVDAVAEWMAEQGIAGGHVAGNSTGAGIALELADRGVVASATALAPIGFWSTRERIWCQRSVRTARALSRAIRPFAPTLVKSPLGRTAFAGQYFARPWAVAPEALLADIDALVACEAFEDTSRAFAGYLAPETAADEVPVTVVWGGRDHLLLPRQANRARRRLPRARHVLIPGAGHLMMTDAPEAVAAAIKAATQAPAPV